MLFQRAHLAQHTLQACFALEEQIPNNFKTTYPNNPKIIFFLIIILPDSFFSYFKAKTDFSIKF